MSALASALRRALDRVEPGAQTETSYCGDEEDA